MAETDTLAIIEEIRSFVSDRLQVVSYKWLSRNFLVSSNAAKRLLEEFVEKYGNGLVVIYSLSGWLKDNATYHIRLVPKHMLSAAKQEFDGNCSVQVYSIQACLPKDPATLWNHEFVQAEDLFKQPSTFDNCLRDNRFCGVSNSFVKRSSGEAHSGNGSMELKPKGISSSYRTPQTTAAPQSPTKNIQNAGSNAGVQSTFIGKPIKTEGAQVAEKEKVARFLPSDPNNKKAQSDKNSSGTGGALASMWSRSSAKSKPDASLVQADNSRQNSSATAEAQIFARESVECESSDDDGQGFSTKGTTNGKGSRKRRVVLTYSDDEDEYENAISLGSPDPPKKSPLCSKDKAKASAQECNVSFDDENKLKVKEEKDSPKAAATECNLIFAKKQNKPKIEEEKESDAKANQHLGVKVETASNKMAESSVSEKTLCHLLETDASKKDTTVDAVVPKRRKVLKTRIDERGREVTVVVWEGEEQDTTSDNNSAKTAENNTKSNAINRPLVVRKSPAVGNAGPANQAGKAGNKKAANKDPKQGNLFSFFKKV